LIKRYHLHIEGIVQGVGFRPFIYRIATRNNLTGFVYNHSKGVEIEVQGEEPSIEAFIQSITDEKPPLSQIDKLNRSGMDIQPEDSSFNITESVDSKNTATLMPPDIATCDDCIRELFDPSDRRYLYPFINCMNCGPRYTIIHSLPYDRRNTTMNLFPLCDDCREEYEDPAYRRFHAEPNACDVCGPHLTLLDADGDKINCEDEIIETINMIKAGKVVAVKSLGGFHLTCDATNTGAVKRLRERKHRPQKPFAVMSFGIDNIRLYCELTTEETDLLTSPQRPIVLLNKKVDSSISPEVAPDNNYLGVMVAYNPVQLLLLKDTFTALVMTSGNMSDEPICIGNEEAVQRLHGIADAFLVNDRDINTRVDDSIRFMENNHAHFIRRARGYVPNPPVYREELKPVLGVGAELKNTVTLSRGKQLFVSQHIGDLKNVKAFDFFKETINHITHLLNLKYDNIAYDLHPDYLSTQYAMSFKDSGVSLLGYQHHKAHVASCIGDNDLDPNKKVIGLALDGTGYGLDKTIWGCEGFVGSLKGLDRRMSLEQFRLPGGEKAIEEPYRLAISCMMEYLGNVPEGIPFYKRHKERVDLIKTVIEKEINSPLCSSMGRLFDAVSSLIGLRDKVSYEAEAAISLQMASEMEASKLSMIPAYQIDIAEKDGLLQLRPGKMFEEIAHDLRNNVDKGIIGIKFHKGLSMALLEVCRRLSYDFGTKSVILSGGVFQNRLLLKYIVSLLADEGFDVITHKRVPCNDGGISFGQVLLANYASQDVLEN
jgi:hydrogenase maturation protein HypF